MAGVGDEQLPTIHVRSGAHPARERDCGDGKSPQGDRFPDGVGRRSFVRAKSGDRNIGLLGPLVSREPLVRRLTPHACVEHLASHRRLADEGAGPSRLKGRKATLCSSISMRFMRQLLLSVRGDHPRCYALYNAASLVGGDESSATSKKSSSTTLGE